MPDFDLDSALTGGDFTLVGNHYRRVFWARQAGQWHPVASLSGSEGTWAVMTMLYCTQDGSGLPSGARPHMQAILKMKRTATPEEWVPVLTGLWKAYPEAFRMSENAMNWQYRPGGYA